MNGLIGAPDRIGYVYTPLHERGVAPAIDDVDDRRAHPCARDATLLELVREDKPEHRVIFVVRIRRYVPVRRDDRVHQLILAERQPSDRGDGRPEIAREVSRIQTDAPGAHA